MPLMDRKILKRPFIRDRLPDWVCPSCTKGLLRLKRSSFFRTETSNSKAWHKERDWEPAWIALTYMCKLTCNNDKCGEIVISSGIGAVDEYIEIDAQGKYFQEWNEEFSPSFFQPHLQFFEVPPQCPELVASPIQDAFNLYFASPSAAANSVRVAVEELLTSIGVKRYTTAGKAGKRRRRLLSLHQRIDHLPAKHSESRELLQALKWLGNDGSHSRTRIQPDDVLDAFEILEHVLEVTFVQRAKQLKAVAKRVNKDRGARR